MQMSHGVCIFRYALLSELYCQVVMNFVVCTYHKFQTKILFGNNLRVDGKHQLYKLYKLRNC